MARARHVAPRRDAEPTRRPPALGRARAGYLVDLPGLAHGSFNALEGYVPSLAGLTRVQRWSRAGPEGARGYEAVATMLERLLRHHVAERRTAPLAAAALTAGLPPGVAVARP